MYVALDQLRGERLQANHDCDELIAVGGMHERKQKFTDLSDGFVTLPGGVGTMDELWEAMSWAQLGYHSDPVGLLNAYGFYDDLIAAGSFAKAKEAGTWRLEGKDYSFVDGDVVIFKIGG